MSLLPWLDVASGKQISLCAFSINTSRGELVNMDEAFKHLALKRGLYAVGAEGANTLEIG